jgi:hypothetical protein
MEDRSAHSIISAQERAAKIREESERIEREQVDAAERQLAHQAAVEAAARQEEVQRVELVSTGETREHLLNRIRSMRNEKPVEIVPVGYMTERQKKQLSDEQEAGRAAVAKAAKEAEEHRARWHQEEIAQQAREGEMRPVYMPNPSQDEQYPANRATLGKK